jgi:hypothetical protein
MMNNNQTLGNNYSGPTRFRVDPMIQQSQNRNNQINRDTNESPISDFAGINSDPFRYQEQDGRLKSEDNWQAENFPNYTQEGDQKIDWADVYDDDEEEAAFNTSNPEFSEQRPVERPVERTVKRPVERTVERPVERTVGPEKEQKHSIRRLPAKCSKGAECTHLMMNKCKFQHTREEIILPNKNWSCLILQKKGDFLTQETKEAKPPN